MWQYTANVQCPKTGEKRKFWLKNISEMWHTKRNAYTALLLDGSLRAAAGCRGHPGC